jgi:Cap4 SAVED domain
MNVEQVIGPHPLAPHPCGIHLAATDQNTEHAVPHRVLDDGPLQAVAFTAAMAQWIVTHHVRPEAIERDRVRREALARQGLVDPVQRFPINLSTQKGNWAEILLAEYVVASSTAQLPVYRLRYNPNVDQSMKGDDVLAFDLDSNPVRVLVGEAKFRSTPSKAVVEELVGALVKSHSGNIPASLQFVAERLFDSGDHELGAKVAACNALFAQGRLQLDYIGLLVSSRDAHLHVQRNAKSVISRLAVMSLGLADPERIVTASFAEAGAQV